MKMRVQNNGNCVDAMLQSCNSIKISMRLKFIKTFAVPF